MVSSENDNDDSDPAPLTTPQDSASQRKRCQIENQTVWEKVSSKDCVTQYEEVCSEEQCSPVTTIKCEKVSQTKCKQICRRVCQVRTKLVWEPTTTRNNPCSNPRNISCDSYMIGNKPVLPIACNLFLSSINCGTARNRQVRKLEKYNCKTYKTSKKNCKEVDRLVCEEIPEQKCRIQCTQEPILNCTHVIKKVPVRVSKMMDDDCKQNTDEP